jgi:hypothetical protein
MRSLISLRLLLGWLAIGAVFAPLGAWANDSKPPTSERDLSNVDLIGRLKSVCADLRLSGEVKMKVDAAIAKAVEDAEKARKEAGDNHRAAFGKTSDIMRAATVEIMNLLDDDQKLLFQSKMRAAAATPSPGEIMNAGSADEPRVLSVGERIRNAVAPLNLSDEQKKKVDAIVEGLQAKMKELRTAGAANPDALREKLQNMRQDLMKQFKEVLSEGQFDQFRENIAQQPQNAGVQGALGGRLVMALQRMQAGMREIGLSDEQKTKVDAAFAAAKKQLSDLSVDLQAGPSPELREKVGAVYQELRTQLQSVLNDEQQEKFRTYMRKAAGGAGAAASPDVKKDAAKDQ